MGLSDLTPATDRDLYWEWVRAELDVPTDRPRSGRLSQHGLDARILSALAQDDRSALLESDWAELRSAFRRLRGDFLDPLLDGQTTWNYGSLALSELDNVLIPNLTISLVPLAPSRRLKEYVTALEAGRETPGLPNLRVYRELRRAFELDRSKGCPVLISERLAGPFVLGEGLTRMSVILSRRDRGQPVPLAIRVLVGVTGRAHEWAWW